MPRDLLRLHHGDKQLSLRTTEDDSATRLLLFTRDRWDVMGLELTAPDVQLLAGALLEWLADGGHTLPDLPVEGLELDDSEDDAQPATVVHVVPEHTR